MVVRYLKSLFGLIFLSLLLLPLTTFAEVRMTSTEIEGELSTDYDNISRSNTDTITVITSSGTRTVSKLYYLPAITTFSPKRTIGNTYKCTIQYWPGNDVTYPETAKCTKTGDSPTDPNRPVPSPVDPSPTPTPTPSTPAATTTPTKVEPFSINGLDLSMKTLGLSGTKGCGSAADAKYTAGILTGLPCNGAAKDLPTILTVVKNIVSLFLLPIVGVLFIIMLIIGGILYITSRGNQQQLEQAKKILTAAIIGLLIVTLSYTLIVIFTGLLGGGVV